jgi:hypothetical protein
MTVLESGGCNDLVDESLLGEGEGSMGGITLELDPQILAKLLLLAEFEPRERKARRNASAAWDLATIAQSSQYTAMIMERPEKRH